MLGEHSLRLLRMITSLMDMAVWLLRMSHMGLVAAAVDRGSMMSIEATVASVPLL